MGIWISFSVVWILLEGQARLKKLKYPIKRNKESLKSAKLQRLKGEGDNKPMAPFPSFAL